MFKDKLSKEKIKEIFDFKALVTESVLKYVFIGLLGLAALGGIFSILSSWVAAFASGDIFMLLFLFLGTPIAVVIGFVVYAVVLRIILESILIRFLTYREVKQINEKTNGQTPGNSE